jgi:hypothetical protein
VTFTNPVVGGTILVRPAIQSPDYSPGVSGWSINIDGTAEFSDLVIRSSDGSGSTVQIANGEIQVTNSAGDVVVELDSTGYRLYSSSGAIVAEIKLDGGGLRGGFYTRNFAFPQNIYAYLSGGQLTSGPVTNSAADIHGFLQYVMTDTATNPYSVQTLSTGAIDMALDDEARIQLISERGQRSKVWVDGGSSLVPADLYVTGRIVAANAQSDTVSISFTAQTSFQQSVTFPTAYPVGTMPAVTTNIASGAGATSGWTSRAIGVTRTGFTLFVNRGDTTGAAQTWASIPVQWWSHAS